MAEEWRPQSLLVLSCFPFLVAKVSNLPITGTRHPYTPLIPRQGFSFGVQGFPELIFASLHTAHCYRQTFPMTQSWTMRPFAWPAVFDEPTYPTLRALIR